MDYDSSLALPKIVSYLFYHILKLKMCKRLNIYREWVCSAIDLG